MNQMFCFYFEKYIFSEAQWVEMSPSSGFFSQNVSFRKRKDKYRNKLEEFNSIKNNDFCLWKLDILYRHINIFFNFYRRRMPYKMLLTSLLQDLLSAGLFWYKIKIQHCSCKPAAALNKLNSIERVLKRWPQTIKAMPLRLPKGSKSRLSRPWIIFLSG